MAAMRDVDKYGVPISAFGDSTAPEFFEILGRLLAVNGKIEYLKDRLDDLPSSETTGVRKVEQFLERLRLGTNGSKRDCPLLLGLRRSHERPRTS